MRSSFPRRRTALALVILLAWTIVGTAGIAAGQGGDITFLHKVAYVPGGDRHQVMDVYIPPGDGPFPGVVVIHGGGWRQGSVAKFAEEARYLAEHGFVAFAITYRLAPQFTFPAQLEDVQSAVRYVREHASEFKLKPEELGALGGSAGAHLAALLGTYGEGSGREGDRVTVVVAWSAPFDLTVAAERGEIGHPGAKNRPVEQLIGCSLQQCPEKYREASPIDHIDPTDAPMFIANATFDETSLPAAMAMDDRLKQDDIPTELAVPQCRCHSDKYEFMSAPQLGGTTVFDASIDFLKTWIRGRNVSPPTGTTTPPPPPPPGGPTKLWPLMVIALVIIAAGALGLSARRRRSQIQ